MVADEEMVDGYGHACTYLKMLGRGGGIGVGRGGVGGQGGGGGGGGQGGVDGVD